MKKLLSVILLLLQSQLHFGQQPKLSFDVIRKIHQNDNAMNRMALLVKGDPEKIKEITINAGGTFKFSAGNISSIMIPAGSVQSLAAHNSIERIEDGAPLLQVLQDDTMRYMNKIIDVHNGVAPLPQTYKGKNVILGIIDTGIDFTHPDFKDSTGQTRIKYIWDHLLPDSSNTPLPYNYGQEFSSGDINNGYAAAHTDQGVHGTVITGISGGNGRAVNMFTGAAPETDLICVSINFNQSDEQFLSSVADAVDYIYNKADTEGKPCVINISAGTYYGSHDGKDLSTQLIDNLIVQQNGRSLVCASGNAGNYPIHLRTSVNTGDTVFTWFKNLSTTQSYCEFWGDSSQLNSLSFTIGADKSTPDYEFRGQLPFTTLQQKLGMLQQDTLFSIDGNRLAIVLSYADVTGDQYAMYYLVQHDSSYNWRLTTTGAGSFDGYSFDWIANGSTPSVISFPSISDYIYPDLNQNMCSGFQCSDKTITVGQYTNMNKYTDYSGTLQTFSTTTGAIHPTSSRGPTRDGRLKPDVTASAEWTFGPLIVSSQPWFITNQPYKIPPTGQHLRGNGTSAASAVVSGIAALFLERYPAASWLDVKNAIINCSQSDMFTGNSLPNNIWGYGKVNAFHSLTYCGLTDVAANNNIETIYSYPNPFSSSVNFYFKPQTCNSTFIIHDLHGKTILSAIIHEGMNSFSTDLSGLSAGMYFAKMIADNGVTGVHRLIRE